MKILVADDDSTTRIVVASILRKEGHQIIAVADGTQALSELSKPEVPLLAILDWEMPGMDGIDVLRRLGARRSAFYVILLTSHSPSQRKMLLNGQESGADDYITKPFNHDDLRTRVRLGVRTIDLKQALAQARAR